MKNFFLVCLILGLLSSCVFRPNYKRPEIDIPQQWRVETVECCEMANTRFWENLGDPVLNALIKESLIYNNDLKAAISRVDQYYALFRIVYSFLFPQINGQGLAVRQKLSPAANPYSPPDFLLQDYVSALINLTYEIDVWGRLSSLSDSYLAQYLAEVQNRRNVVLTIVTNVARGYLLLRQYDEQLVVAKNTLKSFEESYVLAVDRFQGGATSELPVEQARSEMDAAALRVKEIEIQVQQQENLLSVLVGKNPSEIPRGKMLDQLKEPPSVPAGMPSDILEQRPDVMNAELQLIAANSNIGFAKANMFPIISLTGFYGNQSVELRNLFTGQGPTWQVGASVTAPIFNGGRYIAQLEYAKAQEKQALYAYHQAILTAFKEVNDALIAHTKSLEILKVQKDRVAALAKYLQLAELEYDNGQVDYLNVLDAQRQLFSAELDLITSENYTYLTYIDIYKAVGGGWVLEADTIGLEGEDNIVPCRNNKN